MVRSDICVPDVMSKGVRLTGAVHNRKAVVAARLVKVDLDDLMNVVVVGLTRIPVPIAIQVRIARESWSNRGYDAALVLIGVSVVGNIVRTTIHVRAIVVMLAVGAIAGAGVVRMT